MSTHHQGNRNRHWLAQALIVSGLGLVVALAVLVSTTSAHGRNLLDSARLARVAADDPTATDTSTPTPTSTSTATATPTSTNTATPTPTSTSTLTAQCVTLGIDETEPLYVSSSSADRLSAYLVNPDSYYTVSLTSVVVSWPGSGSPASGWHDEFTAPPTVIFDKYLWNGATIANPANRMLMLGDTFTDNLNNFVINANSSGVFAVDFTTSLQGSANQMYRHGHDWIIGLEYTAANLSCYTDLRGRFGPVIQPTVPAVVNRPTFEVSADASDPDPDGSINQVYFEVYDSADGTPTYTKVETTAPYCLGGKNGGVCNPISSYAWPNGVPINDGETYTITIRARDNDPHPQYTRVIRTLTIDREYRVYLPVVERDTALNTPEASVNSDIVRRVINFLRNRSMQP
jgi:hypothetical protein